MDNSFESTHRILVSFNYPSHDPREAKRYRTYKAGSILPHNHFASARCAIRDISASGARLKVVGARSFPREFDLHIEASNLTLPCHVAWRSDAEMGVRFAHDHIAVEKMPFWKAVRHRKR